MLEFGTGSSAGTAEGNAARFRDELNSARSGFSAQFDSSRAGDQATSRTESDLPSRSGNSTASHVQAGLYQPVSALFSRHAFSSFLVSSPATHSGFNGQPRDSTKLSVSAVGGATPRSQGRRTTLAASVETESAKKHQPPADDVMYQALVSRPHAVLASVSGAREPLWVPGAVLVAADLLGSAPGRGSQLATMLSGFTGNRPEASASPEPVNPGPVGQSVVVDAVPHSGPPEILAFAIKVQAAGVPGAVSPIGGPLAFVPASSLLGPDSRRGSLATNLTTGPTDDPVDTALGSEAVAVGPAPQVGIADRTAQDATPWVLASPLKVPAGATKSLSSSAPPESAGSVREATSGNSPSRGLMGASVPDHATSQQHRNSEDKGGSSAEYATRTDTGKMKLGSGSPTADPRFGEGFLSAVDVSGNRVDSAGQFPASGKTDSLSSSPTARPTTLTEDVRPALPMKELSMRIEAAEGQTVDIRIVQRAGDLQIAVKSGDDFTTQGLRHGLSDLANRLNETGYHTETWQPGQITQESSAAASDKSSPHSQSDGSQSHSGGSKQDRDQRQDNPSNRPHWIQELNSNLGSSPESSGQFNGIVN